MELAESQALLIREPDGGESVFDPEELQQRLERCFIEGGFPDAPVLAEAFARSVEYTLQQRESGIPVGRGELNTAVVNALEETGYPAAAAIYRMTGGSRELKVNTDLPVIRELLTRFVACTPVQGEKLAIRVRDALKRLEIAQAAPKLIVELARHFWWENVQSLPVELPHPPVTVSAEEILSYCTAEVRNLAADGVLAVHGITPILPALRFEVKLGRLAERLVLTAPVLDLEIAPELYRLSGILEACRQQLLVHLRPEKERVEKDLPFFLDFPDMSDFVTQYMAGERMHYRHVGNELVRMLVSALPAECALQIKMR